MLGKFRGAINDAIGKSGGSRACTDKEPYKPNCGQCGRKLNYGIDTSNANEVKYAYQRPAFLQLFTEDELKKAGDHDERPIMVPRDITILPWFSGYAEAINAKSKSMRNEDQAAFYRGVLTSKDLSVDKHYVPEAGLPKTSASGIT